MFLKRYPLQTLYTTRALGLKIVHSVHAVTIHPSFSLPLSSLPHSSSLSLSLSLFLFLSLSLFLSLTRMHASVRTLVHPVTRLSSLCTCNNRNNNLICPNGILIECQWCKFKNLKGERIFSEEKATGLESES